MKQKNSLGLMLMVVFVAAVSACVKELEFTQQKFPLIQTLPVTDIDAEGVQFNGSLLNEGTDEVLDHGFVWQYLPVAGSTLYEPIDTFQVSLGNDLRTGFKARVTHRLINSVSYKVQAFVKTRNNIVYGSAYKFVSKSTSSTLITSVFPSSGLDGDTVVVNGENFNAFIDGNAVSVGGKSAKVISSNLKAVKFVVPAISPEGPVSLKVDALFANATSTFTIVGPTITSFTPTHGPAGTSVLINGHFGQSYQTSVSFGNANAYLPYWGPSWLSPYVPGGVPAGNVKITVTVNGKSVTSTEDFMIE